MYLRQKYTINTSLHKWGKNAEIYFDRITDMTFYFILFREESSSAN